MEMCSNCEFSSILSLYSLQLLLLFVLVAQGALFSFLMGFTRVRSEIVSWIRTVCVGGGGGGGGDEH